MQQSCNLLQEMETARLNVLDELYMHLDREDEPWSVHLEIRVDGDVEARRLEEAVRDAARRHPIARARLGASRFTDVRYDWEIADELPDVDLVDVDCAGAAEADRAREALLSRTPSLDTP